MLNRLKQAVVGSYIGAIALGWLLAQGIYVFVGIFAAPVGNWLSQKEAVKFGMSSAAPTGISLQDSLPYLIRSILIFAIWYALVRWLYFTPPNKATRGSVSDQGQSTPLS
jgi:hypothetical protein